jgi:hypothetical protein
MELGRAPPSILWDRRDLKKYLMNPAMASHDGGVLIDGEDEVSAIQANLKRFQDKAGLPPVSADDRP